MGHWAVKSHCIYMYVRSVIYTSQSCQQSTTIRYILVYHHLKMHLWVDLHVVIIIYLSLLATYNL